MKLKYYLRGIGIGILVTVFIIRLTSANSTVEALSDSEIKARAEQLGMIDSSSLTMADLANNQQQEQENLTPTESSNAEEQSEENPSTDTPESQEESIETESTEPLETESTEPLESENTEESSEADKITVRLVITTGTTSESVCKNLQELGLIEDAESFNQYLSINGYSKKIRAGFYDIAFGTSEEEIAQIIMKKQ